MRSRDIAGLPDDGELVIPYHLKLQHTRPRQIAPGNTPVSSPRGWLWGIPGYIAGAATGAVRNGLNKFWSLIRADQKRDELLAPRPIDDIIKDLEANIAELETITANPILKDPNKLYVLTQVKNSLDACKQNSNLNKNLILAQRKINSAISIFKKTENLESVVKTIQGANGLVEEALEQFKNKQQSKEKKSTPQQNAKVDAAQRKPEERNTGAFRKHVRRMQQARNVSSDAKGYECTTTRSSRDRWAGAIARGDAARPRCRVNGRNGAGVAL